MKTKFQKLKWLFSLSHLKDIYREGRCSGFPICCIVWFWIRQLVMILTGNHTIKLPYKHQYYFRLLKFLNVKYGFGYVPCPINVITGWKIIPKHCLPGCSCGLGNDRDVTITMRMMENCNNYYSSVTPGNRP